MHCLGDKQGPKYLRRRRRRPSISNILKVVKTGRLRLKVKITEPRVQCREGSYEAKLILTAFSRYPVRIFSTFLLLAVLSYLTPFLIQG